MSQASSSGDAGDLSRQAPAGSVADFIAREDGLQNMGFEGPKKREEGDAVCAAGGSEWEGESEGHDRKIGTTGDRGIDGQAQTDVVN